MTCSRHIQGDTQAVAQLLLRSLLHLQAHPEQHSSAVKHLLLELLPTSIPTTSPDLRSLALQLFTSYRNPVDAKLSVKVASAFQLTVEDVSPQWGELEAFVADLLQDRSNYTAAVRLMLLFEVCVGGWEGGGGTCSDGHCGWVHAGAQRASVSGSSHGATVPHETSFTCGPVSAAV